MSHLPTIALPLLALFLLALVPVPATVAAATPPVRAASHEWCDPSSASPCPRGRVCAGRRGHEACVAPQPDGAPCGDTATQVCRRGRTCPRDTGVCTTPANAPCTPGRSSCATGTSCAGAGASAACLPLRGPTERCGVPALPPGGTASQGDCQPGLLCERNVCVVPRGRSCNFPGALCALGNTCQGTRTRRLCWPPRKEGQWCGSIAFLRCDFGLTCVRNRCRAGTIREGEPCVPGGSEICANANVCAGPEGEEICVEGGRAFFPCGRDEFSVCREGFRCSFGVCQLY